MVRPVHDYWPSDASPPGGYAVPFALDPDVMPTARAELVEVTPFGSAERQFMSAARLSHPGESWTEWAIRQSRASYLAGTIFWWELEDEVWDALNGRFPRRLGIAPTPPAIRTESELR